MKFAFKITLTKPDFSWNVNVQIATLWWGVNTAITGVHEYNTVINSDRQKTRSNINDVRLNYIFFTLWHSQFQFRSWLIVSLYECQFHNSNLRKSTLNLIQVFFSISDFLLHWPQVLGTALRPSSAFALALFEQQNIVSESKTISNFIKIIVGIMKIFFIQIKLFLGMKNLKNYILIYV